MFLSQTFSYHQVMQEKDWKEACMQLLVLLI